AEAWTHVAKTGDRIAALQPVYDAVIDRFGGLGPDVARGISLRHDWALNTARSTSWGRSPGSVSETTPPSLVSQKPTAAPNGSSAPSKSNASGPNCTTPSTTSARLSRPGPRPTTTNGSSNATATRPHEKHSPQPKARWQHETDTNAVQRTGCCS